MKPIFIVGVGRSGTTLLANLLGSHTELSPVYETPFLRNLLLLCEWVEWYRGKTLGRRLSSLFSDAPLHRRFRAKCEKYRQKCAMFREMMAAQMPREAIVAERIKQPYELFRYGDSHILFDMKNFRDLTEKFLEYLQATSYESEIVYDSARMYVDALFREHCEREGKPIWVNKTPRLLLCLDGVFKLFPTARCIHILRDGRDVVASNLSLSWGPENVRQAARRWRNRLEGRNKVDRSKYCFLEVRYEDLIQSPKETLIRIFKFLELSADIDAILQQFNLYDERVGAWRESLDIDGRKVFANVAGDLLMELGYEKDSQWAR